MKAIFVTESTENKPEVTEIFSDSVDSYSSL